MKGAEKTYLTEAVIADIFDEELVKVHCENLRTI